MMKRKPSAWPKALRILLWAGMISGGWGLNGGLQANEARESEATLSQLLAEVREQFVGGSQEKAIVTLQKALALEPANFQVQLTAGRLYEGLGDFKTALAHYNRAVALDDHQAEAYRLRGLTHFKQANIEAAVEDFDTCIRVDPDQRSHLWQRGIALYLLGKYEESARQFEWHQAVNESDVENSFWHFLCQVRLYDLETARKKLIPVRKDRRVPMMQLYGLLRGKATELDVLNAAHRGKVTKKQLENRLCYSHLYLGLYLEATGKTKEALGHFRKAAVEYPEKHFIGDVARVVHWLRIQNAGPSDEAGSVSEVN